MAENDCYDDTNDAFGDPVYGDPSPQHHHSGRKAGAAAAAAGGGRGTMQQQQKAGQQQQPQVPQVQPRKKARKSGAAGATAAADGKPPVPRVAKVPEQQVRRSVMLLDTPLLPSPAFIAECAANMSTASAGYLPQHLKRCDVGCLSLWCGSRHTAVPLLAPTV
jgi:hypothetical protein